MQIYSIFENVPGRFLGPNIEKSFENRFFNIESILENRFSNIGLILHERLFNIESILEDDCGNIGSILENRFSNIGLILTNNYRVHEFVLNFEEQEDSYFLGRFWCLACCLCV